MPNVSAAPVGVAQWTKTYGLNGNEQCFAAVEHSIDNGLVMGASSSSGVAAGSFDFMLIKTNQLGVQQWAKLYGGASSDIVFALIEHSIDNGLVIAGTTSSFGAGQMDMMIVKTNSDGVEQWTKTYGGTGNEQAFYVAEHSIDNGLVLVGYASNYSATSGDEDAFVIKTNQLGVQQWARTYGGAPDDEVAMSVVERTSDNALVLAGWTGALGTAGGYDALMVVEPSDGSGDAAAGVDITMGLLEAAQTLTELSLSDIQGVHALTEVDRPLTEAARTFTTTVHFANPTPSRSASTSVSTSSSPTASQSASASTSPTPVQTGDCVPPGFPRAPTHLCSAATAAQPTTLWVSIALCRHALATTSV
jgi:hypothetical protein